MAAVAAYRHLLRAARIAFEGDQPILNAARAQIRTGFRENASLDPKSPEIDGHIRHAEDVATILKENVVQGKRNGDKYKLRIHEHTERGDNDTVNIAGGKTVKIGAGCCSS